MTENNITLFIQIIVIITFCVWIFLISRVIIFYILTIKKWKKTEATNIECEIKWFRSKTDSDTEGWKEMIKYKYIVNSIEYENDYVTKNLTFLSPSKSFAENYNFRKNRKIEIAYDPLNPKKSIIDMKFNFLTIIIPIVFYLISYLFLFNNNVS